MAKINDTTTYPNTPPALTDHVPGTDVSNTANDAAGETVTFTLQGVMDLFEANMAAPTSIIASGTFADARIAASNVTQHEAALTVTESQISDLGTYQVQLAEGAFVDGDKTKLDGIEALADVTDGANVKSALEGLTLTSITSATGDEYLVIDATDGGLKAVTHDNLPGGGGGISNVVEDTTPQLGGSLDVNGNAIVSASNGDIAITPNGTGSVVLDGLSWPQADGSANQVLKTDGAGQIGWATVSGGNVDGGSASSAGDSIQWRRDTAANWTSNNPTLSAGEAGYETDTGFIKVGDGSTAWTSLGYTLSGLADPGADRIVFWDDSAGAQAYLTAGTGLSISGTTMTVTGLTVSEIAAGSLTGSDTDLVTGTAGTSGNLVSWDANGDAVDSSIAASDVAVQAVTENAQTGTTYTLVLGDASKLVSMSNASANTLTIPTNASVAFPVGTTIVVMMKGAGTTTITGATGVTVNGVSAGSGDISAQWGMVSLFKSATDTWYAGGSIGTVA